MALPIDVIVKHGDGAAAFVGDGDLARYAEGHRPVTIAGPAEGAVADDHGIEVALVTVPHAEEVAQGDVDTRGLLAVVIDAHADQARPGELIVGHGKPDVADYAGSAQVGHHIGFAGKDALA